MKKGSDDQFSEKEAARRRDEVIRRMANTPPQPKLTTPVRREKRKPVAESRVVRTARAGREH